MYLHTILSEIFHIIKTTPHIMRKSTLYNIKSPYKPVPAFHKSLVGNITLHIHDK